MRRTRLVAAAAIGLLLFAARANAQPRSQVQGFGGLTFGTSASAATFGGSVAVPVGDHLQIIGEGGRMEDLKSPLLDEVLDLTPLDVRLSAWYAEGGVRFIASPHSAVRPYFEGTAGFARLTPSLLGAGRTGTLANAALNFLDTTQPMVGVGAGVMLHGGPIVLDIGYRHKRISAGNAVSSALSLSRGATDVNQVRVGIGFRF